MSRWALPSSMWSTFAASRDRTSSRVYSSKPYRAIYEAPTAAPYSLKSRVSVYNEPFVYSKPYYNRPVSSLYPPYSGNYGSSAGYAGYGASARKSYEPTYTSSYPKPYYTLARDAYDHERSYRRYSSSRDKKPSTARKSVRWDDETYNGRQYDWDRRYDRYGGENNYDYHQRHDRYGRPISDARGTSPRVTAAGDTYTYTYASAAAATKPRGSMYYKDEAGRRTQKDFEYGYKPRSSRRSKY
ncbi:hypothetical protein SPBR_04432 [Sporothrix brasiliensis 5110]|uniref:Uncharacterized protein n=1 Tax=Sporothrix brasiliensis 5110 TaxID=1398154 RepID=A0A0C2IWK4_9PEZI|nr:uncharacterized protein SPBR_04432 [Sporothrix brasiliensis 5110]KIH93536.1 hypothetical protein SPBR_04432 [Sporothrix brasiliensis 5110]